MLGSAGRWRLRSRYSGQTGAYLASGRAAKRGMGGASDGESQRWSESHVYWFEGNGILRRQPIYAGRCGGGLRSEEHTSELQSLMRTLYAVFCLKKKKHQT